MDGIIMLVFTFGSTAYQLFVQEKTAAVFTELVSAIHSALQNYFQ
jgi:hypothetical protein